MHWHVMWIKPVIFILAWRIFVQYRRCYQSWFMQTTEAAAAASKLAPTEGKNSNKASLRIYETTLRVVECCHIRQLLSLRSKLSRKVEPFHARSSLRSHSPLSFLASRSPSRGNTEILARCAQKNCPTMGDIMHHFFLTREPGRKP